MHHHISLIPSHLPEKRLTKDILHCNEITARYGLKLSPQQAQAIAKTRTASLKSNGRVELASSAVSSIIEAFCDSPYISQSDWAETLYELVDAFYYFKNETDDALDDQELISLMRQFFDQTCGSVELVCGRDLEAVARNIRNGVADYANIHEEDDHE